jgi:uncharacterized membrane protein
MNVLDPRYPVGTLDNGAQGDARCGRVDGDRWKGATVDWYLPLKLVHVLSAIIAVGTNVTYFVWLAAMKDRPAPEQSFALDTIKKLDGRLANPAYGILPLTGLIMVLVSDAWEITTFWIIAAIILYALVGVTAGVLFAPSLRSADRDRRDGRVGSCRL